jgi:hypothetical protein
METSTPVNCGIIYDPNTIPQIVFVVKQYFDDFKKAFESYYTKLAVTPNLLTNFEKALRSINSSLLFTPGTGSGPSQGFRADVSGQSFP